MGDVIRYRSGEWADPAVVKFSAKWCGPCIACKPAVSALAAKFKGVATFYEVDADEHDELCKQYRIRSLPTFIVLVKGVEKDRVLGANIPVLAKSLDIHLANAAPPTPPPAATSASSNAPKPGSSQ